MTSKISISRVGIDLDGTVADFIKGVTPLMKEHYGLEPDFSVDAYHIEEVFGLNPLTRPKDLQKTLYEDLNLFRDLPKLEEDGDMITTMLKLADIKVYFITARQGTKTVREDTLTWLNRHGFQYDDVFHTADKAGVCTHVNIDVMYEDELAQIYKLRQAGINTVVRDQPWNFKLPDAKDQGITRVYNWQEAFNAMKEYLG